MELVSDGNITLMRAVEGFDFHRGHRFSTYATLALMKGFARSVPQMLKGVAPAAASARGVRAVGDERMLASVADARVAATDERLLAREEVRQLLARLDDRERSVVLAHYGLEGRDAPATYEQVGRLLGLTKQRVRQIEQSALAKLRSAVAESVTA
jgi:RNA polymerase sigma factor (sigma-70 family)